jgi:hypothetical protein
MRESQCSTLYSLVKNLLDKTYQNAVVKRHIVYAQFILIIFIPVLYSKVPHSLIINGLFPRFFLFLDFFSKIFSGSSKILYCSKQMY